MSVNFEQNAAERAQLIEKQQIKASLRAEYNKQFSNPFRHAKNEGGTLHDPALLRFQAMRVSHYEHFKPTGYSFRTGIFLLVVPAFLYGYWMKSDRDNREHKFRTGQVSYRDRQFKFI